MNVDPKLASAQIALEKAYNASRYGSSEAQSGSISERSGYVAAVLARAQEATISWANWEEINTIFSPPSDAAEAVSWLELNAVGTIRKALARDAILGGFSLSDPVQKNRLTLCHIASWLDDKTIATLSSREWAIDQGHSPFLADAAAETTAVKVGRFRNIVVPDWAKNTPGNTELDELRKRLRATRSQLAHRLHDENTREPAVDEIRRFLSLTLELATDAALIWIGSAIESGRYVEYAREQANTFWPKAFAEPVRVWQADMERRRQAGLDP